MSLLRALTILTISLLSTGPVLAENSRHYFEYDLTAVNLTTLNNAASVSYDNSLSGFTIKYGYDINNWFALEGHLGTSSKSIDLAPTYTVKADLFTYVGARFNLRFDNFTLYALTGGGYASLTSTESGTSYQANKTSVAYGAGLDFYGSKSTAITFSVIQYLDLTEASLTTAQLGVKFYFDKPKIASRY